MCRLLIASLMIGFPCHAIADEAAPTSAVPCALMPPAAPHVAGNNTAPVSAAGYVAKIKFLEVKQKRTCSVETEVEGVGGTPLKVDLNGHPMGRRLKLQLQDVTNGKPAKYVAEFQWVEVQKDGTENVLHAPKLTVAAGQTAIVKVGDEKGDRFEVNLTVTEGASAADKAKPAAQTPANSKPPSVSTPSSLGRSLIGMVHPRIIIQGEEEERLGVARP